MSSGVTAASPGTLPPVAASPELPADDLSILSIGGLTEGKEDCPGTARLVSPGIMLISMLIGVANLTYDLHIVSGGTTHTPNTTSGEALLGGAGVGSHGTSATVAAVAPTVGSTAGCMLEHSGKKTGLCETKTVLSHPSATLAIAASPAVSSPVTLGTCEDMPVVSNNSGNYGSLEAAHVPALGVNNNGLVPVGSLVDILRSDMTTGSVTSTGWPSLTTSASSSVGLSVK